MSARLRILQYTAAQTPGGLLRHVSLLVAGLASREADVHLVLAPASSLDPIAAAAAGAGVGVSRDRVRGKTDAPGLWRFARTIRGFQPDIVHVHLASPVESLPSLIAARATGARIVVVTEHAPSWAPLRRWWSRAAKRWTAPLLKAVIAVSSHDADLLRREFRTPERLIRVIPNGVRRPTRGARARRRGSGSESPRSATR